MRKVLLLVGLIVVIILAAVILVQETRPPLVVNSYQQTAASTSKAIDWRTDFGTALADANKQSKLVLVAFYAEWCGYCRKMDAETFPNPEISSLINDKFIPVKIDSDKNAELSAKYQVRGLPTIIAIDKDGKEAGRVFGFLPPDKFKQELNGFLKKGSK